MTLFTEASSPDTLLKKQYSVKEIPKNQISNK